MMDLQDIIRQDVKAMNQENYQRNRKLQERKLAYLKSRLRWWFGGDVEVIEKSSFEWYNYHIPALNVAVRLESRGMVEIEDMTGSIDTVNDYAVIGPVNDGEIQITRPAHFAVLRRYDG